MAMFVDIETPYSGKTSNDVRRNIFYARACVRDSLLRGETPFASHLFYTQPGILDDNVLEERERGMRAGKELIESLPGIVTVAYCNLGISEGMLYGINRARECGREVEYRLLEAGWETEEMRIALEHSHSAIWGFDEEWMPLFEK